MNYVCLFSWRLFTFLQKSLCLTSANVSYCESSFDTNFAVLYAYYSCTEMYEYDETASYEVNIFM